MVPIIPASKSIDNKVSAHSKYREWKKDALLAACNDSTVRSDENAKRSLEAFESAGLTKIIVDDATAVDWVHRKVARMWICKNEAIRDYYAATDLQTRVSIWLAFNNKDSGLEYQSLPMAFFPNAQGL